MLWKKQTPTKSELLLSGASFGLQKFSDMHLYKRLIWEKVEKIISHVQTAYPDLKWTKILDPWISRNIEHFATEDIWAYSETPVSFCGLIYIHECMSDLQDRMGLIGQIQGPPEFVAQAKAFGFFRLFDVVSYFTSLYNNETYMPLYFRLKSKRISNFIGLANELLAGLQFLPRQYIVLDFLSLSVRLFYRFRVEVLAERFFFDRAIIEQLDEISHTMAELDSEGESRSPSAHGKSIQLDHSLPEEIPLKLRKYSEDDANHNSCRQFLENKNIYERVEAERRIMQRESIEFCLTYLLHDCLKIARQGHKEMIQNALNIIEKLSQTTKRFWRLDPRSFVEYYEKSEAFYRALFKIYRDVIEFRRNSIVSPQTVGPVFSSYYLSYTEELGYHIKHGLITTHKLEDGESFMVIDDTLEGEYPVPEAESVEVILPGFINLHTHTKYNFQGSVNFGTKFNYRFEWRQLEYEGRHVVSEDKILKRLFSPAEDQSKDTYSDIFKTEVEKGYTEADLLQFKRYVKMYTHLQSVISGTTSIFMECEYEKKEKFPEIIRSTIIKDPNSKNITSNDLYVIWRNQKNKDNLVMIWSKDFIKFLTEVVGVEIEILLENQKNRINLHVHLAEGKSDAYVTICEFDNFCYDIICLEHFIRHIRDRLDKFQKGNVNVVCTSRIMENFGVSIIAAENAERTYRCELQIKKLIVKSDEERSYRTNLDMTIIEQHINQDSLESKEEKVKNLKEPELTQTYKLQTIRGNLLIVHANGFQWHKPLHRYLLETYETNICVSPYSNLSLYGTIRDFNWARWILDSSYRKYRKYLCLGTDWNPTGKENILEEARYLLRQMRANNVVIDQEITRILYDMITINPARVTKMSIGKLGDSFYSDFWIGKFHKSLLFSGDKFKDDAPKLIEYVLREFDYQNNILGVYCAGELVYSQAHSPGLQEIYLKNELKKYFLNPEGTTNQEFQKYVQTVRDTLAEDFEANISLLFP